MFVDLKACISIYLKKKYLERLLVTLVDLIPCFPSRDLWLPIKKKIFEFYSRTLDLIRKWRF